MNLSNLEYFREVSINGVIVDNRLITGEIDIANDQSKTTEASFTMYTSEQFVPFAQNPRTTAISMMNQQIVIKAGYLRQPDGIRTLFKGKVTGVSPIFPDGGQPLLSFECMGLSVRASVVQRNQNYPVVQRDTTPTVDSQGNVARPSMTGDVRTWAVIPKGSGLTLKTIITNIIAEYNIPIINSGDHQSIICPDVTFDGKDKILFQRNESDWKFLQRLAYMYSCEMTIDPDTDIFYFVPRTTIRNQTTLNNQGQTVTKELELYYHRYYPAMPANMVDFSRLDPALENAALVMQNISYSFDATTVQGGMISNYTDKNGKQGTTVIRQEDDGSITQENYVLRTEMLNSPEADAFIKKYAMGEATWEQTKQFYKVVPVQQVEQSLTRVNPPVYPKPNFEFDTLGTVWATPMKKYNVYNMGFGRQPGGVDSFPLLCTTVNHKLGETFKTRWGMMVF